MIGLVLEGGGAKGAYHIGVFRALEELNINLDGVVGTSIGAINGAMIAEGDGPRAWEIWSQIRNSDIFNIRKEMEGQLRDQGLNKKNLGYVARKIRNIIKRGGLDTSIMTEFLGKHIREEDIRKSKMDYGLVTVSLTAMKPIELLKEDIPSGEMLNYIMASASFPGFKPRKIDGQTLIDGGIWNNLPVNLLIDKGYDSLIAVRTNAVGRNRKIDTSYVNIFEIEPSEELAPIMDFNEKSATRDLNLGYYDTLRIFKGLRGRRYYIEPHPDPDWFLKRLIAIDEKKIEQIGELLGIKGIAPRRMLFEHIVPRLSSIFGIAATDDYEEMATEIYETVAIALDMPRFEVYGFEQFIRQVKRLYPKDGQKFNTLIPGFIKTSPHLSKMGPHLSKMGPHLSKMGPHLSKMAKNEILGDMLAILFDDTPSS